MLIQVRGSLKRRVLRWLHSVSVHPGMNITVGLILLTTALFECFAFLFVEFGGWGIGTHHGILVLAVTHLARAIPDLFKGIKFIDEGELELVERKASVQDAPAT